MVTAGAIVGAGAVGYVAGTLIYNLYPVQITDALEQMFPLPIAGAGGAGAKKPPTPTSQAGEPCDKHHPWPEFLGGPKKQELVEMSRSDHQQLHRDLTGFLKDYTDAFGNTMSPSSINSGAQIRLNFSPAERWNALNDFYTNGPGADFPDAAQSFYQQFPSSP